jgi:hypothetical protein
MTDIIRSLPWTANVHDLDDQEYRVVRAADGRPLAYIDKHLSLNQQEDVARLVAAAPKLLHATRGVFYANAGAPQWTEGQWNKWRGYIGPVLAELWSTEEGS